MKNMLKEKLLEDLKNLNERKNEIRKNTIQNGKSSNITSRKDNNITIEDEKIIEIVAKRSQKRKDSLNDYEKSGREDLIEQVKQEIGILQEYYQNN